MENNLTKSTKIKTPFWPRDIKQNITSINLDLISLHLCYISDVEGEVNVDFEIEVPDFVPEVPGPTGPCFDLGGGGVSTSIRSHQAKAEKPRH